MMELGGQPGHGVIRVADDGRLEVVSLSTLYPSMGGPFSPGNSGQASCSTLRPRKPWVVPAPLIQQGRPSCAEVADFSYSEILAVYPPNAIVTRTGVVIYDDRYIIEESLEGVPEANGIGPEITREQLAACPCSDEIVINTNKLGMWNYSLFTLEVAPAIMLASLIPGLEAFRMKAFFHAFMPKSDIENRMKVFGLFGIGEDRIVIADQDMCRHKGVVLFKLNDKHGSQRLSQMLSPTSAVFREAYATNMDVASRKIYISRQNTASRKVSNFDDLNQRVLAPRGFLPVELERLTVEAQVDLFSKADVVVAEHGAGLANIAFMRPGSFVIELRPEPIASRAVYRYMAAHCRLNYVTSAVPVPNGWRWDRDHIEAPLTLYEFLLARV